MLRTWLRAGLIAAILVAGLELLLVIATVEVTASATGEATALLLATAALDALVTLPLAGALHLVEKFAWPRLPGRIRTPPVEAVLGIALGAPTAAYLVGALGRVARPADLEFAAPGQLLAHVAAIAAIAGVAILGVMALPWIRRLAAAAPRLLQPRALLVVLGGGVAVLALAVGHVGLFSIHLIGPAGLAGTAALGVATVAVRLASPDRAPSRRASWVVAAAGLGVFAGGTTALRSPHTRFVLEVHVPTAGFLARAVRALADRDGDGSAPTWLGGADCVEGDAAVGPGQREVPGDGIDQDCRGGDAAPRVAAPPQPYANCTPPTAPLGVLLITIDALRADALDSISTPNLMAFARGAIVHDHATSPATNTSPSMTSLLGGRPVSDLIPGGNVLRAFGGGETTVRTYDFGTPVPHRFRLAGFRTSAINPFALFAGGDFQRLAGFDALNAYFHDQPVTTAKDLLMSAQIVDGILRQVRTVAPETRLFLWAHIPDLHAPYLPAGRGREPGPDAPAAQRPYLRAVGYVDNELGRLLATLHAEHFDQRYAIVITSDHGEELGQRGREGHGPNLYEESIRVPLLISLPGCTPRLLEAPVSITELGATLGVALGVPVPGATLAQGGAYAVAEAAYGRDHRRAITSSRGKLIVSVSTGGRVLFDLAADPGETRDVYATATELRSELEGYYQDWLDRP